jgi:hypothetical protein
MRGCGGAAFSDGGGLVKRKGEGRVAPGPPDAQGGGDPRAVQSRPPPAFSNISRVWRAVGAWFGAAGSRRWRWGCQSNRHRLADADIGRADRTGREPEPAVSTKANLDRRPPWRPFRPGGETCAHAGRRDAGEGGCEARCLPAQVRASAPTLVAVDGRRAGRAPSRHGRARRLHRGCGVLVIRPGPAMLPATLDMARCCGP